MTTQLVKSGTRGFDCNAIVDLATAQAFMKMGYRFALRYVPRVTARSSDVTETEIAILHQAGLGVMAVQHVESESSWVPTDDKGRQYGDTAGDYARAIKLSLGSTVWLDLEGVDMTIPHEQIIRYCNYWHDRVAHAGYEPGIYVGWHSGLTQDELYKRLKFTKYWAAYNLNTDQYPTARGICMKQYATAPGNIPSGLKFQVDINLVMTDKLGGLPSCDAPAEWSI